jgi:hypothetical protein
MEQPGRAGQQEEGNGKVNGGRMKIRWHSCIETHGNLLVDVVALVYGRRTIEDGR